jgi:hypothetical protein
MRLAERLARFLKDDSPLVLLAAPQIGIILWRPSVTEPSEPIAQHLTLVSKRGGQLRKAIDQTSYPPCHYAKAEPFGTG